MKRITLVISITTFLAACGGSGGSDEAGIDKTTLPESVDTSVPDLGAALADPVDTATLEVSQEFNFATARSIDIEFDIAEAQGQDASISICSRYEKTGDAYDVDYDSCSVEGYLVDGVFNHSMEVTNEFDSVVGVVWFQDQNMMPLYREFFVDDAPRIKADGTMQRTIVWK